MALELASPTLASRAAEAPPRVRIARALYAPLAWLLAAAILVQVFLAGMAVMAFEFEYWQYHKNFVHAFEIIPLLLAAAAGLGRGRWPLVVLSLAGSFLIGIQYPLAARWGAPPAAFHVVNAFVIFGLTLFLARWGGRNAAPAAFVGKAWN